MQVEKSISYTISQIKLIFSENNYLLKISNWRMFKKIKKLRKEIVR